jgi:hypothetical protein
VNFTLGLKKKSTQQQLERKVFVSSQLIILKRLTLKSKRLGLPPKLLRMAPKLSANPITNDSPKILPTLARSLRIKLAREASKLLLNLHLNMKTQ